MQQGSPGSRGDSFMEMTQKTCCCNGTDFWVDKFNYPFVKSGLCAILACCLSYTVGLSERAWRTWHYGLSTIG